MKDMYKELLGKVYDLEGLLVLVAGRKEIPQELSERVEKKIRDLYEFIRPAEEKKAAEEKKVVEEKEAVGKETVEESVEREAVPASEASQEVEVKITIQEVNDRPSVKDSSEEVTEESDKEGKETPQLAPAELQPENTHTEEDVVDVILGERNQRSGRTRKRGPSAGNSVLPADTLAAVKEEFSLFYSLDEDEEKGRVKKKGKPKYSLNDRFLYTRELFKGDAKAFAESIDKITEFSRYEDAEAYFVEELQLQPEKTESHKAFLKMIKNYLG